MQSVVGTDGTGRKTLVLVDDETTTGKGHSCPAGARFEGSRTDIWRVVLVTPADLVSDGYAAQACRHLRGLPQIRCVSCKQSSWKWLRKKDGPIPRSAGKLALLTARKACRIVRKAVMAPRTAFSGCGAATVSVKSIIAMIRAQDLPRYAKADRGLVGGRRRACLANLCWAGRSPECAGAHYTAYHDNKISDLTG